MVNRLVQLISQKQTKENRILTLAEISKHSGVHVNTLRNWMSGEVTRFDKDVLVRLCRYFECDLHDLIHIDWEGDPPKKHGQIES